MVHYFSTNSGDGNDESRGGGSSGDRSDHVKGSMDNFLRQAKNKISNDEKKPWSQLLNHSSDAAPHSSSSGGGSGGGSHGGNDRKDEKKRKKPMLDDEILASLDQDDQYDSDYSPSDAELYRQANDVVIDEYNPRNIGLNSDETFLPSDLDEEDDGPNDDRELEELVDAYLDPTPEKVKSMESTSAAADEDQHLSDLEMDSKNDKTEKALRKFNEGVEYFESKNRRRGRRRDESDEEELETLYDELRNASFEETNDQEKDDGYASDDPPGYQYEDEVQCLHSTSSYLPHRPQELSMLDAYDKIEDMGRQGLEFNYEGERFASLTLSPFLISSATWIPSKNLLEMLFKNLSKLPPVSCGVPLNWVPLQREKEFVSHILVQLDNLLVPSPRRFDLPLLEQLVMMWEQRPGWSYPRILTGHKR